MGQKCLKFVEISGKVGRDIKFVCFTPLSHRFHTWCEDRILLPHTNTNPYKGLVCGNRCEVIGVILRMAR
jgi:hypothetical protein